MTNSFIAIKGDYLNKTEEIFTVFGYEDLKQDISFDEFSKINNYLRENYFDLVNKQISIRGIWFDNGWTIISDPEMVDILNEDQMLLLASTSNADVFSFTIQTTSNTFGFSKFTNTIERQFLAIDGEIINNNQSSLVEEQGLNINKDIFIDDIFKLANNAGIHLQGENASDFIIKQLGYNETLQKELGLLVDQEPEKKKPWWKW